MSVHQLYQLPRAHGGIESCGKKIEDCTKSLADFSQYPKAIEVRSPSSDR